MRAVDSVSFTPDGGVVISFLDPATDVRNRGLLTMGHQLVIQPGEGGRDYGDEVEDLRDAVRRLLDDAMNDWATTTDVGVPMTPSEERSLDDEGD